MTELTFTIKEQFKYLSGMGRTIYNLLELGELSGFKVRGIWRFMKEDIDKKIDINIQKTKREENKEFAEM